MMPVAGSTAKVMIFSGVSRATSSMLMPPAIDAMKATRDVVAVDQRRKIELALDRGAFLDIEAADLLAVRAGLVGDQRRAKQRVASLRHVVDRLDHLDAAGLAAAAGVDLRLDHHDRRASSFAAFTASSTENAGCPRGTGTPNSRSTALPWYSWMFMRASLD